MVHIRIKTLDLPNLGKTTNNFKKLSNNSINVINKKLIFLNLNLKKANKDKKHCWNGKVLTLIKNFSTILDISKNSKKWSK